MIEAGTKPKKPRKVYTRRPKNITMSNTAAPVSSTTSSTSIQPQNDVPSFTDRLLGIPESATKVTNTQLPIDENGNTLEADERTDNFDDSDEEQEYLDPILRENNARDTINIGNNDVHPDGDWQFVQTKQIYYTKTRSGVDVRAPVVPLLQRRTYKGACNIPLGVKSPTQFMELIFTDEILNHFVEQTNLYVSHQDKPAWDVSINPLTIPELKKFFGLQLYMGIVQRPNRKMYFNSTDDIWGDVFVKETIGRNRFLAIQYNLHWLDASWLSDQERGERNRQDGFWSIETFLEMLNANFKKYFECGQFMSIDEMTIFFKGRHRCKCYNPNKPNKWHFKAYCLNDSVTGYLWNFFMYRGKDEQRPPNIPATLYPVTRLTDNEMLFGKDHFIITDNYFSTVADENYFAFSKNFR